jgi:hypothetical protein
MRRKISAQSIRSFLATRGDADVHRIHYCYQIGSTFVNLALMEDTIINAMSICDRIKVASVLGSDTSRWNRLMDKTKQLQSSTLGNLIAILSKHSISQSDLNYLRWVKQKRDYFVHRFFQRGDWPGDLNDEQIYHLCRTLLYLERIFIRASHRIWLIFGRANLMIYQDLGKDGALMINPDMFKNDESD